MSDRPIAKEIPYREPSVAFGPLAERAWPAFLDSAAEGDPRARYSYLACDPVRVVVTGGDGITTIDGVAVGGDPFTQLTRELDALRMDTDPELPPFQGGAIGFLGYELGGFLERLPVPRAAGLAFPQAAFAFYDTIAAFDVVEKRAWVIACDLVPGRPPAGRRLDDLAASLGGAAPGVIDWRPRARFEAEIGGEDWVEMVRAGIDYINAGDIFQVNLTGRFLAERPRDLSPFELYRRLRRVSAAPFAAFLGLDGRHALASASPERFLNLKPDRTVETRPIKGTRPRGRDPVEDRRLADELVASEKDNAENLMIVDLLRNDLSRAALIGSVDVPQLCGLETFASVHHLVSVVRARLKPGMGAGQLLRRTFPGGSITGAPKVRAMEIIHELEPARRGPYCGTVFWAGFDGAMDSSIVIRTLAVTEDHVVAQAGGGIVADSDPRAEHLEALTKATPLFRALDPGAELQSGAVA